MLSSLLLCLSLSLSLLVKSEELLETPINHVMSPRERHHKGIIRGEAVAAPPVNLVVTETPGEDCLLPGGMRDFPIPTNSYSLPLCFGYGVGVEPGYLVASKEYMSGSGSPNTLWEAYSCPAQDPIEYLKDPLRCFFTGDQGILSTFVDAFTDRDFIKDIVKGIFAPLAANYFWSITPFALVEKVLSFVCKILNFVEDIFDLTDIIYDIADAVMSVVNWLRDFFGVRRLSKGDTPQIEYCESTCSEGFTCWRPISHLKGLCLDSEAMKEGMGVEDFVKLYGFLIKTQVKKEPEPILSNPISESENEKESNINADQQLKEQPIEDLKTRTINVGGDDLPQVTSNDVNYLVEKLKSVGESVVMEELSKEMMKVMETPVVLESLSEYLNGIADNLSTEKMSFDPSDPSHRLFQSIFLDVFDTETGELKKEKLSQMKRIRRDLSESNVEMNEQVHQEAENMSPKPDEFAETFQLRSVAEKAQAQSCPTPSTSGMAGQICDFIEDGIKSVKNTVKSFIEDIIAEGIELASSANLGGACLGGGISMVIEHLNTIDPFSTSMGNVILRALIDTFDVFVVEFLYGTCSGICDTSSDVLCCLPSRYPGFEILQSGIDPETVVLIEPCNRDLTAQMQYTVKLIEFALPLLEVGVDAIIQIINIPFALIAAFLQTYAAMAAHVAEVCENLSGTTDGIEIGAIYQDTVLALDNAICRPTNPDTPTERLGFGCDGVDNDCNFVVDDCAEDSYPPHFIYKSSILPDFWFTSSSQVTTLVSNHVTAQDDCYSVEPEMGDITGSCENSAILYSVSDACGNSDSVTIPFKLDLNEPTVTCSVQYTNLGHQGSAKYTCGVGRTGPTCTQDFVDVGLSYSFSDDCGVSSVSLSVYSDEYPNVDQDAFFIRTKTGSYTLVVNQKQVFPYGFQCINCIGAQSYDGRVYTIKIRVTDVAGRIVEKTCPQVGVRDVYADPISIPNDSLYRFLVQQFVFEP
jgi:hypothetical protein